MSLRFTTFLQQKYRKIAFGKRWNNKGVNVNKGLLNDSERGESFTEPEVYRNRRNVTAQIKVGKRVNQLRREEMLQKEHVQGPISDVERRELELGKRAPLLSHAREIASREDDQLARGQVSDVYTRQLHDQLHRETERRNHLKAKFGQTPTSREFHKLFKTLQEDSESEEIISNYQRRLAEENGIYSSSRVDAYMLDDDTYFPDWVEALPYTIKDQVKFGSLGLTEEDEALRVRLSRMPKDEREREWKRIKSAKEYAAANEGMLTLAELRQIRQGKRRFHWLQRKRERRAQSLRRMALRNPEGAPQWPSNVVDYSQRIAFIAQHVENNVQTGGKWPLSSEALLQAKINATKHRNEGAFLELDGNSRQVKVAKDISDLLSTMDEKPKKFKRISRKAYANRVNAVVHGDQDEYGRKYRKLEGMSRRRQRPYDSLEEMALEKETRKEPLVNVRGLQHHDDENWTKRFKSWSEGMPSTRYGS